MTRPVVAIPEPIHPAGAELLASVADLRKPEGSDPASRRSALHGADGILVRNMALPAGLIDSLPALRVIAKHGTGVDNIDLAAATAAGIPVANVPGGNAAAVAEGTAALILATLRRIPDVHGRVLRGEPGLRWTLQFQELRGATLGLIGLGDIGSRVARICTAGFGMSAIAYDPGLSAAQVAARGAIRIEALDQLLARSDVVSLHLPLVPSTRHIIDAAALARMKPGSILVNAARGGLVDEDALAEALASGHLWGAGLDVFETEPPLPDSALLRQPGLVATPHVAGSTEQASQALAEAAARIVIDVLAGRPPETLLNPEVWERRRIERPESSLTGR